MDGVLTDGRQYIGHDGEKMFKAFHSRDIKAIRQLVASGVDVVVASADDWPGGAAWCERVGARFLYTRDKIAAVEAEGYSLDEVGAVGDSAWDVGLLRAARWAWCPCDAEPCVLQVPGVGILDVQGGHGVLAMLLEVLPWTSVTSFPA